MKRKGAGELEKLIGFMLFFTGFGMVIGLLIAENVILVVAAGISCCWDIIFSAIKSEI